MNIKKFFITFLCLFCISNAFAKNEIRVNIKGNKHYNADFYKEIIKDKLVGKIDKAKQENIKQKLLANDFVADANVEAKNNVLNITIKEKKTVRNIIFNGNKKLKKEIINDRFKTKAQKPLSIKNVEDDVALSRAFYKSNGMFNTTVEYEIKDIDDNFVDVIFNINEGKKAKIGKIIINGNKHIGTGAIKDALYNRENAFFRFGNRIVYNEDLLEYNTYLIRLLYFKHGYLNCKVVNQKSVYNEKKNRFNIIFDIDEGMQFKLTKVNVVNNTEDFDDKIVYDKIKILQINKVFDYEKIEEIKTDINKYLSDRGLYNILIDSDILPNEDGSVTVDFRIGYNDSLYIKNISISNNIKTYDYVIRNKLLLHDGDLFNKSQMDSSIRRIKNLGFFKDVDYTLKKDDGFYDVNINVEEKPTGQIGLSIGYSTLDRANIGINYAQKNLFGKGIGIGINTSVYEYSKKVSFNLLKPEIFNTNIDWSTYLYWNVYKSTKNSLRNIDYDTSNVGIENSLYFELFDNFSQRIGYTFDSNLLKNISDDYKDIVPKDRQNTSAITNDFYYDTRDYIQSPKNGYIINLNTTFAGIGGNKDYIKNVLSGVFYKELFNNVVFKIEGKIGHIASIGSNKLYPTDGFYLGGRDMIGFEYAGIGPRVIPLDPNDSLKDSYGVGGTRLYFANAELKIPLGLPSDFDISAILFVNAGTVTGIESNKNVNKDRIIDSGSIRSSCGVSFVWNTPMGISLSLDFSKAIKKEKYDLNENFRFNIGRDF